MHLHPRKPLDLRDRSHYIEAMRNTMNLFSTLFGHNLAEIRVVAERVDREYAHKQYVAESNLAAVRLRDGIAASERVLFLPPGDAPTQELPMTWDGGKLDVEPIS